MPVLGANLHLEALVSDPVVLQYMETLRLYGRVTIHPRIEIASPYYLGTRF
jgi:hypothetical protein